jgi:hypothetical protein
MNKIISKIVCVLLVSVMLLSTLPAFAFAGNENLNSETGETQTTAPTFNIKKVSETTQSIVVTLELVNGSFLCLDATVTANSRLTCTDITFSESYKTFIDKIESEKYLSSKSSNPATGIIAVANTKSCADPMDIATYTFSKSTAKGVISSEISLAIDSCYISTSSGDVEVTPTVTSNIPNTHTHVAGGDWVITKAATCTEEGTEVRYCSECGEIAETRSIAKIAHDTYEVKQEPTCTVDGFIKTYCKVCGQLINTEILKATGHVNTHEETVPPTCTVDGYTDVICDKCGEIISHTVIPATGHKTHTNEKAATCTEDGYIDVVCEVCGETISHTVLKATGHKYITEHKDATCTEDGYIIIKCAVCGDIKSSVVISKINHVWSDWTVVKPATYRSTGVERRTCKLCGEIEEREIPMIIVPPTGITISMSKLSMTYKQTSRLYANVLPEEAAYSADITWSSSNPKVCSVDEDGNIKATGKGTAVITASTADGKYTASCSVTVDYSTIQWIIIVLLFGWLWY